MIVLGKTISEKVKTLSFRETAPLIENSLRKEVELSGKGKDIPVYKCNTLEEAVKSIFLCRKWILSFFLLPVQALTCLKILKKEEISLRK